MLYKNFSKFFLVCAMLLAADNSFAQQPTAKLTALLKEKEKIERKKETERQKRFVEELERKNKQSKEEPTSQKSTNRPQFRPPLPTDTKK